MLKYHLQDFSSIGNKGFELTLPENVIAKINDLVKHVGSPNYIRTPVFQKNGKQDTSSVSKKKREKPDHVANHAHWERMKKFQTTKLEEKSGIELQVNNVRSYLNKLTDKTLSDVVENISNILDDIRRQGRQRQKTFEKLVLCYLILQPPIECFPKFMQRHMGFFAPNMRYSTSFLKRNITNILNPIPPLIMFLQMKTIMHFVKLPNKMIDDAH